MNSSEERERQSVALCKEICGLIAKHDRITAGAALCGALVVHAQRNKISLEGLVDITVDSLHAGWAAMDLPHEAARN